MLGGRNENQVSTDIGICETCLTASSPEGEKFNVYQTFSVVKLLKKLNEMCMVHFLW